MKYRVVGEKPEMAVFAHATGPEQRYFMLMIQPKLDAELATISRELVFLVDVSGSMSGEPMAKVQATLRHFFRLSKPDDTLQVVTFAGQADRLFERPVPITKDNIAHALAFTQQLYGSGGTEMLEGIKAVLNAPVDPERVRIVVMLTDGYIGNEAEIIAEVGRRAGDTIRFWTIGIGSSPNRFLIDGVAKQGSGMSGVLGLNTNPKELVRQIVTRIHRAQLADIQIDWGQLSVYETYPRRIPELWAGSPMILFGRYAAGGETEITLSGTAEGTPLTYPLEVTLPDADPTHDVLAKVWARKKIEDLSAQMDDTETPEVIEEITRIVLDYRLMSQYTSFVAVDESEISDFSQQPTRPRRVVVPVPLPEGVDFQGIFGWMEEEPQFYYDLFGPEQPLAPSLGRRNGLNEDYHGYGYGFRGRYTEFAGDASYRFEAAYALQSFEASEVLAPKPVMKPTVPLRVNSREMRAGEPKRDFLQAYQGTSQSIQQFLDTEAVKRHADAKTAVADAQTLQQNGHLEEARLRYQHALGLMAGIRSDDDGIVPTAMKALESLRDAILKKRVEAYPELNRKLNLVLRNQPLADAIRTLVTAGGFQFDLVPGSLNDVATLLYVPEGRVTYLDLRHATVVQGLEWLLAPYHLTWQMKDAETITVGTTRRMPGTSVWGYDVHDIVIPFVKSEFYEDLKRPIWDPAPKRKPLAAADTPLESIENALTSLLKTIKAVAATKADSGLPPDSVTLINLNRLLIYGDPAVHEKVNRLLEGLRDGEADIISSVEVQLSGEKHINLRTLQKLTVDESKKFAEARQLLISAKGYQRVSTDLQTASWQLLAQALKDEIDLEALTKLQMAWASPQLEAVVAEDLPLVMRSAWYIRTAAQAVPTDMELTTLSESVLSKVKQMKVPKSEDISLEAYYLGTLYAALTHQTGNAHDREGNRVIKALIKASEDADVGAARLIAEGLLSASEKNDRALQAALAAHQVYDDDLVLLTCLIAKRRGGKLWRTFWEELPDIANQSQLSGHIVVIVNQIAASRKPL